MKERVDAAQGYSVNRMVKDINHIDVRLVETQSMF